MEHFDFTYLLLYAVPLIFAITVHEAAHAYVAKYYGDNTAELLGRLTLNPLKHIDPIGTILVPIVMIIMMTMMMTNFIFGWAKPVPINYRKLRNTRIGMRMVALAGPLSNIIMLLIWSVVFLVSIYAPVQFSEPLFIMAKFGMTINAVLFALNMLPILPLDGGRVLDTFLPAKLSMQFQKIEPYGTWIIVILLVTKILGLILFPIVTFLTQVPMIIFHFIGLI